MAKRGGDKLFHRKKEQEAKDLKRKIEKIDQKKSLIISCEDSVSAPAYFNLIVDELKKEKIITPESFVIVPHDGSTDPQHVLERLTNYTDLELYEHKWIVIDRDEERVNGGGHKKDNYDNTIASAKSQNIEVAFSNPSFEIWYLLHLDLRSTAIDREEVISVLKAKITELEPHKFSKLDKQKIKQTKTKTNKNKQKQKQTKINKKINPTLPYPHPTSTS